jgi:hypothetical protein
MASREQNERKFPHWLDLTDGGWRYWRDVSAYRGGYARYVKEVDANEQTTKFYQEIYNAQGELAEIHEKFPVDRGHQKVK